LELIQNCYQKKKGRRKGKEEEARRSIPALQTDVEAAASSLLLLNHQHDFTT